MGIMEIKMKYKKFILLIVLLIFPVSLSAATLKATFSYDSVDPDEFVMFDRTIDNVTEVARVDGSIREMEWTQELTGPDCHTYYMTAITNGVSSQPSNPFPYCPEITLPDVTVRPGGTINLNIQITE